MFALFATGEYHQYITNPANPLILRIGLMALVGALLVYLMAGVSQATATGEAEYDASKQPLTTDNTHGQEAQESPPVPQDAPGNPGEHRTGLEGAASYYSHPRCP